MFKIGQTVWCLMNGKGVVNNILDNEQYCVEVLFNTEQPDDTSYYTMDGKYYEQGNRTLYFSEPKIIADENPPYIPTLEGKLFAFQDKYDPDKYDVGIIVKETKECLYLTDVKFYMKNREVPVYELVQIDLMNYEDKNAK